MKLLTLNDMVDISIRRLQEFEPAALAMNSSGYWLAFSGGKDSQVIEHLAKRSGVRYTAHFNVTTVDPPELLQFIRTNYPSITRERPALSMFQLIEKKMMPPSRLVRYCCEALKERGGNNQIVVTGIRHAESKRRSKRKLIENCLRGGNRQYLNPIIDWSTEEVWQYIQENNLLYCKLYDEGFTRIGCIGCPMTGRKQREIEFQRWPKYERAYRKAFNKAVERRIEKGKQYQDKYVRWNTGEAMFNWWMQDTHKEDCNEPGLFE